MGIAPKEMPGLDFDVPDVFIPIAQREYFYPHSAFLRAWNTETVAMYGRFRPGLSPAAVREGLRSTMQAIARERREIKPDQWLEPVMATDNFMRASERREILAVASLIAALTSLVLIVVAANLGNLVMSRAMGRVRELGVRMALGARRSRIVRQLVVESVPLVVLGTLGSLLFASVASTLIASVVQLPPYLDFGLDWRTLFIAVALAALALLVVGVLPAWKVAQQHLIDAIKDGGQHVSRALDRAMIRRVMVAAQVAGSCLLLIVAGMMVRSVQRLLQTDLGFDYERAAVLAIPLGRYGMTGNDAQSYWYAVKDRVNANPEVEDAAIVTAPPLGGRVFETSYDDAPRVQVLSQNVDPRVLRGHAHPDCVGAGVRRRGDRCAGRQPAVGARDVRHGERVGRELSEVGAACPLVGDGRCRTESACGHDRRRRRRRAFDQGQRHRCRGAVCGAQAVGLFTRLSGRPRQNQRRSAAADSAGSGEPRPTRDSNRPRACTKISIAARAGRALRAPSQGASAW